MDSSKDLGAKANRLIHLKDKGYPVPNFFVIKESDNLTQTSIDSQLEKLNGRYFAVRSSANVEDGHSTSFAGQFKTKLFVKKVDILNAIETVRLSKNEKSVIEYSSHFDIQPESIEVNVIVQEMIDASQSGVAFGSHFLNNKKVINSTHGLGIGIVDGQVSADEYIETDTGWESTIQEKLHAYTYYNESLTRIDVEANQINVPSLNDQQVNEVSKILDDLENEFDHPQDIEFCYQDNEFILLQSRDITTENKDVVIWDNSNIVESYPGITSPFTFSFIQDIYATVYKNFAVMLGVSQKQIVANEEVFESMLGHIKGRVYYHLIHWYKALALLPGYKLNAPFMEKMMGVEEPLNYPITVNQPLSKTKARIQLVGSTFKLLKTNARLPKLKKSFTALVNEEVNQIRAKSYLQSNIQEIWADYVWFKDLLVNQWQPPLANDLFAMIYFGSLQSFCEKHFDDKTLHTKLIVDRFPVHSTKPALLVEDIIHTATKENLIGQLQKTPPVEIWKRCETNQFRETGRLITSYIEEFGDRSVGELKLENETFRQEPTNFIKILSSYQSFEHSSKPKSVHSKEIENAYAKKLPFYSRWWFRYLTKKAAETVADRENLRLERTKAFGIVRKIIFSIGERLHQDNQINAVRDVFYVTEQELGDYITNQSGDMSVIIDKRKAAYSSYKTYKDLPIRITQKGELKEQDLKMQDLPPIYKTDLSGIASCEGIVKAEAKVLESPNDVASLDGKILITKSTDPGWITIFKSASGVIVERGSSLSHASIVCREMGIPCIVAVKGVTSIIKSGDIIKMDGAKGVIEISKRGVN